MVQDPVPTSTQPRKWRLIGPGIVVAATGVGAGDLVATLNAGSRFGYLLLWAVIIGVIFKIILVEGAGRYSLATGNTIFHGWRTLGRWTTVYFAPYIVIWGFVYGATAMLSSAFPLATLFPFLPLWAWALICGALGFLLTWFGKYQLFENAIAVLVGIMVITVVGAAIFTVPNIPELITGIIPRIPEGGIFSTLALAGGVGGTITLAAYGYWLREKGWSDTSWMRVMRLDNTVAYIVTGVFVIAMLIVGAELLFSAGIALGSGDQALIGLSDVLRERYGPVVGTIFLIGFWASSFSSLVGVWNGVSLMFADFLGTTLRHRPDDPRMLSGGLYYKIFVLWLTVPPIILVFLGEPIFVILLYGVLGALFMPFLAITLIGLLNTDRIPREWRNGIVRNVLLGLCAVVFIVLGGYQVYDAVADFLAGE